MNNYFRIAAAFAMFAAYWDFAVGVLAMFGLVFWLRRRKPKRHAS